MSSSNLTPGNSYNENATNQKIEALATRCVAEIKEAVRQFGSYSYNDKGPTEVMDVDSLVAELRQLAPADAASVLRVVANAKGLSVNPVALSSSIACDLHDWDALFEQPGIDDIMGDDKPDLIDTDVPIKAVAKPKAKKA